MDQWINVHSLDHRIGHEPSNLERLPAWPAPLVLEVSMLEEPDALR